MFKSKSSSHTDSKASKNPKESDTAIGNGKPNTEEPLPLPEVGKEAKEKDKASKDNRQSWVKTIGFRTLRMKKDKSNSNRLSIPNFSSLDRKKRYSDPSELPEHVKVPNNTALSINESNKVASENKESSDKHDPSRFLGDGLTFRGKLIGVLEVSGPRGDRICQEALSDLKMAVKAAGEHKQKVTIHVALDGIRIRDEKTVDCLYHHQVHKISFIAQDLTDSRAFGYIFGSPDTGHRFFGIKTEKQAGSVVVALRDLFQVVFDLKKKEIENAKKQLEMQQKFLATRAAETAPATAKPKFSIAETYIEGGATASNTVPPNRTAPEVDLLNLEEELTSLQVGLDSIHHNFATEVSQLRGSTGSISSDPMQPRSSVSSSHGSNPTPVPNTFNSPHDPFGDSFEPFPSKGRPPVNFQLGPSSKADSALTSPFTTDPFAQEDPFPRPRYPGDTEFLNSDPFDSPSGPFSFSFPAHHDLGGHHEYEPKQRRTSPSPKAKYCDKLQSGSDKGVKDGWAASFEDSFVPDTSFSAGPSSHTSIKADPDLVAELDPLASDKQKHSASFKELSKEPDSLSSQKSQGADGCIPNSFSTNFNPSANAIGTTDIRTPLSSFTRSDSPPNYSPPPPPRMSGSASPKPGNTHVPFISPPAMGSPRSGRKKSPQILKQMTIANSTSSPKTLPKTGLRMGKHHTLDSSLKDDIPNLSPPPRPPHTQPLGTSKPGIVTAAVPRPTSASTDKSKRHPGNVSIVGIPPEPPPRPMQSSTVADILPLVSPPPLPPKKNTLSSMMSMSNTLGYRYEKTPLQATFSRSSVSESNDLPLPLPLRKLHGNTTDQTRTDGRYEVPVFNHPIKGGSHAGLRRPITAPMEQASNMTMEQALEHVASMSLRDLSIKLAMPVDQLSSYTIQQLAQKLTEMDISGKRANKLETGYVSSKANTTTSYGFDDDFSTVSAPPTINIQKATSSYDRYAAFREIAAEDAGGFSIINNLGRTRYDEDQSTGTLEKPFTSRESSSERTLQADDFTEADPMDPRSASYATAMNTMDDVTDVNLSDDQDNDKFALEDEDDTSPGFVKSEWATFENNFDDQFATTALVKADGNESPWESDEGLKPDSSSQPGRDHFDFKPFVKPAELLPPASMDTPRRKPTEGEMENVKSPERTRSPHFQRQNSGSSRHSERSNPGQGKSSDYSDSGRPDQRRRRRGSKDYDRWDFDRDREGSGRYRDRDRDKELRSDSRSSYSSVPQRYRNGESDEECERSMRRRGYGRRSKDYDREPDLDDEDEERSFASHHSGQGQRYRHKRYPPGKHYHSRPGRRGGGGSPERYSNHESDDESLEEEGHGRKRERDATYTREREYYERHHRPRPTAGSASGKRYNRESPRHSDPYYRRERRGRYRDEEEYDDSRDFSDYSGEDEHQSHHGHYSGGHRRMRAKRTYYRDKDSYDREPRGGGGHHYYTNSPSWDSESNPEAEKSSRRPNSGKNRGREERDHSRRESPPEPYSSRRQEKESRKYQSELALSKAQDSPKSVPFDDNFGAFSENVQSETQTPKSRNASVSSPLSPESRAIVRDRKDSSGEKAEPSAKLASFEDDFDEEDEGVQANNQSPTQQSEDIKSPTETKGNKEEESPEEKDTVTTNGNGEIQDEAEAEGQSDSKLRFSGRRLESIKSEEEKSNDSSQSQNTEVQMKKSDSFNIFKQRTDDPFADDEFFA